MGSWASPLSSLALSSLHLYDQMGVTLKVTALEFYDLINLRASAFIEEEDCEEVFEPQFPPQQNVSRHGVKGPLHV